MTARKKTTATKPKPKRATKPKAAPAVIGESVPFEEAVKPPRALISYSDELADNICELIATRVAMDDICAQPGFPCQKTIYNWKRAHPEFAKKLEDARLFRAEARADRIDMIIEEVRQGKLDPNAARVIIDAEKWQAGKENKRYADKVSAELTGANGKDLIPETDNRQIARALLDASPEIVEVLIGMRALSIPKTPDAITPQAADQSPQRLDKKVEDRKPDYTFDPETGKLEPAE